MPTTLKNDTKFDNVLQALKAQYGEELELLNGFHQSQLDPIEFTEKFIERNKAVSDVTIDSSANAYNKDIRTLMSEKYKARDKLDAFRRIYNNCAEKYGEDTAGQWLISEYLGRFYLHNSSTSATFSYCFAYDLTRLALEGLFFINNYNNEPAKHLTTFLDDVIEYVSFAANRTSGACGLPDLLTWVYYFWKKDCESGYYIKTPDYYLRQCFQKLIYRLNQPFIRVVQSSFTNVNIFDRPYLESLFGGVEYPDGSFVIDCIDEIVDN